MKLDRSMAIEYMEIIFVNVSNKYIDDIIKKELHIKNDVVKSSHFYYKNADQEFSESHILSTYFSKPNTGSIFVSKLDIGVELDDVVVLMSFNVGLGDITLHFTANQLVMKNLTDTITKIKKITTRLLELQKKYGIDSIRIGHEPVMDDEEVVLELSNNNVFVVNRFCGKFSEAVEIAFNQ